MSLYGFLIRIQYSHCHVTSGKDQLDAYGTFHTRLTPNSVVWRSFGRATIKSQTKIPRDINAATEFASKFLYIVRRQAFVKIVNVFLLFVFVKAYFYTSTLKDFSQ